MSGCTVYSPCSSKCSTRRAERLLVAGRASGCKIFSKIKSKIAVLHFWCLSSRVYATSPTNVVRKSCWYRSTRTSMEKMNVKWKWWWWVKLKLKIKSAIRFVVFKVWHLKFELIRIGTVQKRLAQTIRHATDLCNQAINQDFWIIFLAFFFCTLVSSA